MTRTEAQALMPDAMARAFERGRKAADARAPKTSNPYGGVEFEAPREWPAIMRKHTGWLRAEWFWGYEDVYDPHLPEQDAYGEALCAMNDALRAAGQDFADAYFNACWGGDKVAASTPEQQAVYEADSVLSAASLALDEARRNAGLA